MESSKAGGLVCIKFPEKAGRSRLQGIDFSISVSDFKQKVSEVIDVQPSELRRLIVLR